MQRDETDGASAAAGFTQIPASAHPLDTMAATER
jgi:hypothetical protein